MLLWNGRRRGMVRSYATRKCPHRKGVRRARVSRSPNCYIQGSQMTECCVSRLELSNVEEGPSPYGEFSGSICWFEIHRAQLARRWPRPFREGCPGEGAHRRPGDVRRRRADGVDVGGRDLDRIAPPCRRAGGGGVRSGGPAEIATRYHPHLSRRRIDCQHSPPEMACEAHCCDNAMIRRPQSPCKCHDGTPQKQRSFKNDCTHNQGHGLRPGRSVPNGFRHSLSGGSACA